MNITSAFRPSRRHAARKLAETQLLGDPLPSPELSLPEALAAEAAQRGAQRAASGPQIVVDPFSRREHPHPQESVRQSGPQQQAPGPRRPHPQPQGPQPSFAARPGTGPFPAAPRPFPAAPPRRGPQPTQSWRPDFAEASRHARPYVPHSPIRPLSPATPMLIMFRNPRARRQALSAAQARVDQVSYPVIDIRDHNGQRERYAALMRHYDAITGTSSPFSDPDAVYRFRYSDGTYRDGPAWPAPVAPEIPQRMERDGRHQVAITAGEAS